MKFEYFFNDLRIKFRNIARYLIVKQLLRKYIFALFIYLEADVFIYLHDLYLPQFFGFPSI